MAAQASVQDAFTFVGGLVTEGGYFITPENSYKEGVNVIPQIDGVIERRNGLDYEDEYALYAANISLDEKDLWAFTTGTWSTVAGNGNRDFIVAQLGRYLHFYNAATGSTSASRNTVYRIDLNTYKVAGNVNAPGIALCSFASTYGRLIVTSADTIPIIITYTPVVGNENAWGTFAVQTIDLKIRDFKGKPLVTTVAALGYSVGQTVAIDEEFTADEWASLGISIDDVKYNLYNQGWTDDKIDDYRTANSSFLGFGSDPENGKYPANTKSWIYGKNAEDDFDSEVLNKQDFGNSPAPKGHFIIDPFQSITYRPKACAFFAGRTWYAGMPTSNLLGTIFFSQVLDDVIKVGNTYQTNDPTSEVISDLEDDDGGTIEIPEAGEIVGLQPLGRGIMVLATNGVWFISGIDQGFKASNYAVDRVSSVGCVSGKTAVAVEGSLLYWSTHGIYVISASNSVEFSATNISDKNIKSFYQDIPVLGKLYSEGVYNATDKTVYWLYSNSIATSTSSGRFNKNTVLAFDTRLTSWYWFSIDDSVGVIPTSIIVTKETSTVTNEYNVLVGSDTVISSTDTVVANINNVSGTRKLYKVLTLHKVDSNNYSVTFSDWANTRDSSTKFKDWYSYNNVGAEKQAYFITGYNMGGNGPARAMAGQYLTVFMKRTETAFDSNTNPLNVSGCLMQSRWDFTDNSYPGKWAAEVQVYRQLRPYFTDPDSVFDDGYPLVISKNKLRGRGKAVQFKFTSEAGKDMKIVGWTGTFIGNTNV
jgi:hypothetical protein